MTIGWSADFVVLIGEHPAATALEQAHQSAAQWVLVLRDAHYWYVFSIDEVEDHASLHSMLDSKISLHSVSLSEALDLHESDMSAVVPDRDQVSDADGAALATRSAPTARRLVELASDRTPKAVGGADVGRRGPRRSMRTPARARPSARPSGRPGGAARGGGEVDRSIPMAMPAPSPASEPPPASADNESPPASGEVKDEGTAPVRFPSIETDGAVMPGRPVTLEVDLRRRESPTTRGGPLELGEQPEDWASIALDVTLLSPAITFNNSGRGVVTIRRNAASDKALVSGEVNANITPGSEITVTAQFWNGTRFSGMAVRSLRVDAPTTSGSATSGSATSGSATSGSATSGRATSGSATSGSATSSSATSGTVQVDRLAVQPDLTVYISLIDPSQPGRLHWRMVVTPPFHTLPPKLDGVIDLGSAPATESAAMYKQLARLTRGSHERTIEGFGEMLWQRAPEAFHQVYWSLHDHYQRALTIQFISDDPHMPWELMAPHRDGEVHEPLALRHAVARWISRFAGLMRNTLPTGQLITVAPRYSRANLTLSLAEQTAQQLTTDFGATSVPGTLSGMLSLLEQAPAAPVAMLYFTGHGAFSPDAAAASVIKLEDGEITVQDVARQRVMLGKHSGTVVFFNACEVGATTAVLGTVGGWADAFLSRHFSAFIAPLWAIDEEDASVVTNELMTRMITNGQPLGAALRDVRRAFGHVSPTFYSYLLYGDVTAHLPRLSRV